MKIDGYGVGKLYGQFASQTGPASGSSRDKAHAENAESSDRVEISPKASDMNSAGALAQRSVNTESAAEREQRIANIKGMIETGQYSVSSETVAQSILRGVHFDAKA